MITPEAKPSPEFFPLNPEQTEHTLNDIRRDPQQVLLKVEAEYLEGQNPDLSVLLVGAFKGLPAMIWLLVLPKRRLQRINWRAKRLCLTACYPDFHQRAGRTWQSL